MKTRTIERIGEYSVEVNEGGWQPKYRLVKGEEHTDWGRYEDSLMLNGMVAISPYYTDSNRYELMSPEEACKRLCVGKRTRQRDDK